ncbi:MAG TPA: hypothetical protein VF644_00730 [Pyrinomonadaceae bacterium]|jgi:hypothetical protein
MAEKSKKEANGSKPEKETQSKEENPKPTCGIMMPISEIDGCSAQHWSEVLAILQEAIESASFIGSLVSESDEMGVIHKTIVQNTYHSDIVVCDVSGKNPNVMFELGLRLAFDKPTVLIKDESTDFSFDTSPIRHLPYPRDLNYHKMVEFKKLLKGKLENTYSAAKSDPQYSPFLKNFGEFTVAQLENKEVSSDVFILQSLKDLKSEMSFIRQRLSNTKRLSDVNLREILARQPAGQLRESQELHGLFATKVTLFFTSEDSKASAEFALNRISQQVIPAFEANIREYEAGHRLDISFYSPVYFRELESIFQQIREDGYELTSWIFPNT